MGSLAGRTNGWGGSPGKGLLLAALLLPAAAFLVTGNAARAESDLKRSVLGTIVAPGALELQRGTGAWVPATQGTPVLEDTGVRTGSGKRAMLALGKEGVIGVGEESGLHIGSIGTDGLPISLQGESNLTFRLPMTTTLTFVTDAAVIKGPHPIPASADEVWIQGIITQRGTETTVSVLRGDMRVRNREATEFSTLGSGEQAIITGSLTTPRIARMTEVAQETDKRRAAAMFGGNTGLIVAGATAVAVGAGVGGAAAAGAFDSTTGAAQGTAGEPAASPFRP